MDVIQKNKYISAKLLMHNKSLSIYLTLSSLLIQLFYCLLIMQIMQGPADKSNNLFSLSYFLIVSIIFVFETFLKVKYSLQFIIYLLLCFIFKVELINYKLQRETLNLIERYNWQIKFDMNKNYLVT